MNLARLKQSSCNVGLKANTSLVTALLCGSLMLTLNGCQQHLRNQTLTHQNMSHQNMAHQSSASNTIPSGLTSADLGSTSSIEQNATTPSNNTHSSTTNQGLSGLTEITWQQVLPSDINRSAAISPRPLVQNRPYLRFNQRDQRFSGNDGCNQILGSYQARANTLTLSAIASTRRACLSGDDLNNGGFVHALNATQFYQFEQDQLILLDHKQQILLTFSKSITQ